MNGRKSLLVLCLICLFITSVPSDTFAALEDVDPYQALFHEDLGKEFDNKPIFMQYSPINYRLDYLHGDQTASSGSTFLLINTILSFCMVGMALAAKLTIDIMTWAFSYNEIGTLTNGIQDIVDGLMDNFFFTEFFVLGVFGLGLSLLFTFNKREDVAGKLLKVIINLIIAFTLITNMGVVIKSINQLSQWGSDAVFIAFQSISGNNLKKYSDTDKGKNAFLNISSKFFEFNVHIPWQLSEFGLYFTQKNDAEGKLTPDQQELKEEVNKTLSMDSRGESGNDQQAGESSLNPAKFTSRLSENNNNTAGENNNELVSMTSFGIPFRIFVVWFTFTVGTLYGCLLLALAGTAVICQFLLFLLAIIAPVVFLLVLIPEWGDQMLIRWIQGLIASTVYKIIASLLLVMILFTQGQIYDLTESWAYAMFAQVVLVFAVFLFRKNLLEYIPLPGMAAFQYTENTLFDKGKSIVDKTFDSVVDRAKSVTIVGNVSGMAGNRGVVSTRASVTAIEEQERSRRDFFRDLGNVMKSTAESKSEKQEQNQKSDQTSLSKQRRRANLVESGETSVFGEQGQSKRKGARNAVTGKDGFVHVGDVKEAIDRLAESQTGKIAKLHTTSEEDEFKTGQGLRNANEPVDVRIVDMKPLPTKLEEIESGAVKSARKAIQQDPTEMDTSKKSRKALEPEQVNMETIEVNKRTVKPVVNKEKVEEVNQSIRKIGKLPFPNVDDHKKKEQQLADLDPLQLLEQQALGPDKKKEEVEVTVEEDSKKKKKGGWLSKMVDKFKG